MARKKSQNYFGSQNDSEIKGHLPNGFGYEISWPHLATQIATHSDLSISKAGTLEQFPEHLLEYSLLRSVPNLTHS